MKVQKGSKVKVSYEGKLENGDVFDSSKHDDHEHPLEFEAGKGRVLKGFDDAIDGMSEGEEKEFTIDAKDAYGEYNDELKKDIPRKALPPNQEPKAGMTLMMKTPDGRELPLRITNVSGEKITIDLNHPLAGKKLIFKIKILEINND